MRFIAIICKTEEVMPKALLTIESHKLADLLPEAYTHFFVFRRARRYSMLNAKTNRFGNSFNIPTSSIASSAILQIFTYEVIFMCLACHIL